MKKNNWLPIIFLSVFISNNLFSDTYYSRGSGNWATASTWSTVACGGTASVSVPGSTDHVIICTGHIITVNGNPASCYS